MPTRNLNTNLKVTGSIELEGILYDGNSSAGTNGQVLSSTSTGTDWVTLSEISGVDGTGTANYLSKWLDANTITNSLVYDNGTNVGIGTTSPNTKLHIKENGYGFKLEGLTDGKYIRMSGNGSDAYIDAQGQNFLILNSSGNGVKVTSGSSSTRFMIGADSEAIYRQGNTLKLRTNSEDRLFISSTGNVGIGTVSPSELLHILGEDPRILIEDTTSSNHNSIIEFSSNGINPFLGTAANQLKLEYGSYAFKLYRDNGTHVATFDGDGNVGIGTTSPDSLLEISSSSATDFLKLTSGGSSASPIKLIFEKSSTEQGVIEYNRNGDLELYNTDGDGGVMIDGSASAGGDFYVSNSGNVGIGTTNPSEKLEVSGNLKISSIGTGNSASSYDLLFYGTTSSGTQTDQAAINSSPWATNSNGGNLIFETSNTSNALAERMRIDGVGNVGIGTNSPSVNSRVTIHRSSDQLRLTDGSLAYVIGYDNANLRFKNSAGDTHAVINWSTGKVGIGTTSPSSDTLIEINGGSYTRGKTRGIVTNYATSEGWAASAAVSSAVGYFGGNFTSNGPSTENKIEYDIGPFGLRELIWKTIPETVSNDDGGWNKAMDGFNNSAVNGFISVVYVKRSSSASAGTFYHGCNGSSTNNLNGTANTNPYFHSPAISYLPENVWCVAIGVIYAANDSNTATSSLGGIYRLDTGVKITGATTYRQKPSNTLQQQRVYHFYSTSPTAKLDFAKPAFYVTDGSEPTLSELTAGAAGGGDDVYWTANGNDIYNDNTGNVGIGTTSPSAKLDVSTTSGAAWMNLINGSETNFRLTTYNNGTGNGSNAYAFKHGLYYGATENAAVTFYRGTSSSGGFLTFTTNNGSERMRISSAGSVGIGTTSPSAKLNVTDGGSAVTISNTYLGHFQSASNAGIAITAGSSSNNYIAFGDTDNYDEGIINYNNSTRSFAFRTADGTLDDLVINSSGNVGIGTASPSASLDVNGNVRIGQNDTFYINNTNVGIKRDSNDLVLGGYGIRFRSSPTGDINSQTERMRITSAGKVGIGTVAPNHTLDVEAVTDDIVASFNSLDNKAAIGIYDNDTLIYLSAENGRGSFGFNVGTHANNLNIDASGNVGIGTTSPASKLHISDASVIGMSSTGSGQFAITGAGYTAAMAMDNSALYLYHNSASRNLVLGTDETARLTIKGSNGNVGIGVANPIKELQVNGSILIKNNSGYTQYDGQGNVATLLNLTPNNELTVGQALHVDSMSFNVGGTDDVIFINSSGNVGIGTNSPSAKLHVHGTSFFFDQAIFDDKVGIGTSSPSSKLHINDTSVPSSGDLISSKIYSSGNVAANSNTRTGLDVETNRGGWYNSDSTSGNFKISSNHRIGNSDLIGVKSLATVDVNNAYSGVAAGGSLTAFYGKVSTTHTTGSGPVATGYGLRIDAPEVATDSEIGTYYGAYIDGASVSGTLTNKYALVTEASAGNVGIGTTSPAYRLHVAGTVGLTSSLYFTNNTAHIQVGSAWNTGVLNFLNGSTTAIQFDVPNNRIRNNLGKYLTDSSTTGQFGTLDNQSVAIVANNSTKMTILSGGNVGIGTTSPATKLAVNGNTLINGYLHVDKDASPSLLVGEGGDADIYYDGTDMHINPQRVGSGDLIIDNGNVGIGTTSPTTKFHIDDNATSGTGLLVTGGGVGNPLATFTRDVGGSGSVEISSKDSRPQIKLAASSNTFALGVNGSTFEIADNTALGTNARLSITNTGNVGIGTTSPASELDVNGVTTSKGFRTNTSNTNYNLITRNSTSTTLYVQAAQSNSTQTIASFRYGSATANAGTETLRIRRDNINVFGANFTVDGSITGNSKNFSIKHPTKEGKRLVHSCLEGPEVGVYFRGRSKSNIIEVPDYWGGLVHLDSMTVELTAIGPNQDLYVEDIADDGEITVGSNTETPLNYFYVVYGERKDIGKLEIEVIDAEYSDESTD